MFAIQLGHGTKERCHETLIKQNQILETQVFHQRYHVVHLRPINLGWAPLPTFPTFISATYIWPSLAPLGVRPQVMRAISLALFTTHACGCPLLASLEADVQNWMWVNSPDCKTECPRVPGETWITWVKMASCIIHLRYAYVYILVCSTELSALCLSVCLSLCVCVSVSVYPCVCVYVWYGW